jgi:hypothetical protein
LRRFSTDPGEVGRGLMGRGAVVLVAWSSSMRMASHLSVETPLAMVALLEDVMRLSRYWLKL